MKFKWLNNVDNKDLISPILLKRLKDNDIIVELMYEADSVSCVNISCYNQTNGSTLCIDYQVHSLPSIINFSCKTSLSTGDLIIMRSIAHVLCEYKILYKAIVLDLDDTLWKGTLSEIGIKQVIDNMHSQEAIPFILFMRFVKSLAEKLGIFIAICSRNNEREVLRVIDRLDESVFPIKNQIDIIIANNNDKSDNIALAAEKLSILPGAMIFIDDNHIVRDNVREKLPDIFTPEWTTHEDLITKMIASCCFERNDLSISSQNRKKQYRLIQVERIQNKLPNLIVRLFVDNDHRTAIELYTKSNQFNFSQNNRNFGNDCKSLYFKIFRESGDDLGICAALTYQQLSDKIIVQNWAMSCRFFEIGVEEMILLYLKKVAGNRKVLISYQNSGLNKKVSELRNKYSKLFLPNKSNDLDELFYTLEVEKFLHEHTNLKLIFDGK